MKRKKTKRKNSTPEVRKRNGARVETHDIVVGGVAVGSVEKRVGPLPYQARSVIARRGSVVQVQEAFSTRDEAVSSIVERHKTTPVQARRKNKGTSHVQAAKRRAMRR